MRKIATFLIFLFMLIMVLMLSSCSVKISSVVPDYQQRDKEAAKFKRGKMRPDEFVQWSLFIFSVSSLTDYTIKHGINRKP